MIAITEINPRYYSRELFEVEYNLTFRTLGHGNFKSKDLTQGIAVYIRETLYLKVIDSKSSRKETMLLPNKFYHLLSV